MCTHAHMMSPLCMTTGVTNHARDIRSIIYWLPLQWATVRSVDLPHKTDDSTRYLPQCNRPHQSRRSLLKSNASIASLIVSMLGLTYTRCTSSESCPTIDCAR